VIDLLREAAIDPDVVSIKITFYRLAPRSRIVNAITNAVRNGKQVTAVLELRARFDEEANLEWKEELEEAGVKVLIGIPNMKVHGKLCIIRKHFNGKLVDYGFVSTGNLNERTAKVYGDHCLLTANPKIMGDVSRIFSYLEQPKTRFNLLKACRTLLVSPTSMRQTLTRLVQFEINQARLGKPAAITLKVNSLSDQLLIQKLTEAARAGVEIKMVIRGIFCMLTENKQFKKPIQAISIVDEYLEHARVIIFHHKGEDRVFISSADWMVRNLDHRVEAAAPVFDPVIKAELIDMLGIQLSDNVKARKLENELANQYVNPRNRKKVRSQVDTYNYLYRKLSTSQAAQHASTL
jgi:polyphosphate kinase